MKRALEEEGDGGFGVDGGEEGSAGELQEPSEKRMKGKKKQKKPKMKWGLRRGPITGLRGVLVTCAVGREQRCANEISQFLDGIAARILGEEEEETADDAEEKKNSAAAADDEGGRKKKRTLEEMLAEEKAAMGGDKKEAQAAGQTERLQAMYSGVNGVIFVRVMREDLSPTALCHEAAVAASKADCPIRLRQTIRIIPLEKTCQVNSADITNTVAPLLLKSFLPSVAAAASTQPAAAATEEEKKEEGTSKPLKKPGTTYHIEYRSRNCSAVHRQDGINAVLRAMPDAKLFDEAGVCAPILQFKNSEVSVIVELFKSTCGLAVAPEYDKYKQYNIRALQDEVAMTSMAASSSTTTTSDTAKAEDDAKE